MVRLWSALTLCLLLFAPGADADVYDDAAAVIGDRKAGIVRLPPAAQAQLQEYFDKINEKLDFPEERASAKPQVILVLPSKTNFAAFVQPGHPEFVFWNPRFLADVTTEDVDRYVMAHERRHFTQTNKDWEETRTKEYDADLMAITLRLFRVGTRDPVTGNPQDAVVHVDTLIQYLQDDDDSYRDQYMNYRTLAAGVKVLYAQERSRRGFPSQPTGRDGLRSVLPIVKGAVDSHPLSKKVIKQEEQDSQTVQKIQTVVNRVSNDYVGTLRVLNQRREDLKESLAPTGPDPLTLEFGQTIKELKRRFTMPEWMNENANRFFEAAATLPDDFFTRWHPRVVNAYNELGAIDVPNYWLKYAGVELDYVDSLGLLLDPGDGELNVRKLLRSGSFELDFHSTLLGTSRLMRNMNARVPMYDLSNRPLTVFMLRILNERAEQDLPLRPGQSRPHTVKEFGRKYGNQLQRFNDGEIIGAELMELLSSVEENKTALLNLTRIFLQYETEYMFPGLRSYLMTHLPAWGKYAMLRYALSAQADEISNYTDRLFNEERYEDLLGLIDAAFVNERKLFDKNGLFILWKKYLALDTALLREQPYTKGLDQVVSHFYSNLWASSDIKTAKHLANVESDVQKDRDQADLARIMTARALMNPAAFIVGWNQDGYFRSQSGLAVLVNWREVFAAMEVKELWSVVQEAPGTLATDSILFRWYQEAFANRLLQLIQQQQNKISEESLSLATLTLNQLSSASPSSQTLTEAVVAGLLRDQTQEGGARLAQFMRTVRIMNFQDLEAFVDIYVRSVMLGLSYHGIPFWKLPFHQVHEQINYVRRTFDPQLATRILNRLAQEYRAPLASKDLFAYSLRDQSKGVRAGVEDFHIWNQVLQELSEKHALNLIDCLRGVAHLTPNLALELQIRLGNSGVVVRGSDVEEYVKYRFSELSPMHRAGIFQVVLEGTTTLLDKPAFRRDIFVSILKSMPKGTTRDVFLDIWEAGMTALPKALRSLVLSIVLSESGTTGTPQKALVTLLSHMGPLEQKFGQALAFADLPESYRTELRNLWDSAQSLSWWEAWELLQVQKGDVTKGGYQLNRVLQSGSTEAFLELSKKGTKKTFVVPVFRDGVQRSVEVGSGQLRIFARELVRKNSQRYGFLPLLVEDSIRTMKFELDPEHKRSMSLAMSAAYKAAALRLGFTVDGKGIIDSGKFKFTSVPFVQLDLTEGNKIYSQELADGVPMRLVKEQNPQRYQDITRDMLALESEVFKDPTAPVDKDRMPGQNIVNMVTGTDYILDHGQALILDPKIHAVFVEFTSRAFSGDAEWLLNVVRELSDGMKLPESLARQRLASADIGIKPLIFLNAVSTPFLALDDRDPRKDQFFQLVHGVRAQLRLLQWEQSEGLTELSWEMKSDVMSRMTTMKLVKFALNGGANKVVTLWQRLRSFMAGGNRRMERAYKKKEDCSSFLIK